MDLLNKIFPISTISKYRQMQSLIISLIVYIVVAAVPHLMLGLFTWLPLVGWIFSLIRNIINIYCTVGIVLSVLKYFQE